MSDHDPTESTPPEADDEAPRPPRRGLLVGELLFAYGTVLAISVVPDFSLGSGSVRLDHPLLLTAALIYLPFLPYAQRRMSLGELGLGQGDFRRSLKLAGLASLVVFPLFLLVWYGAGSALGIPAPRPITSEFPYDGYAWADLVARQFLGAAIPEEWFFRGYLQRRVEQLLPDKRIGKGRFSLSAATVIVAYLFAMAHVARYGNILRLNVFIPGLFFGWARERGGHLAAPILLHAMSNLVLAAFVG